MRVQHFQCAANLHGSLAAPLPAKLYTLPQSLTQKRAVDLSNPESSDIAHRHELAVEFIRGEQAHVVFYRVHGEDRINEVW